MASIIKITNNENYNVYKCNNSEMFLCRDYFTVGKKDYTNEFCTSNRKDIAVELCDRLNCEEEVSGKCLHCNEKFKNENDYFDGGKEITCFLCGETFDKPEHYC